MANVLTNQITASRLPRNKRFPGVSGGTTITNVQNPFIPIEKAIIPFGSDSPTIPDYSIYADVYGQVPTIELFTYDVDGNLIKRVEQPYFTLVNGLISSISFGTFGDGSQIGFITIAR